jgi:ABC-type antimicrobial peptide transport system permease subunit
MSLLEATQSAFEALAANKARSTLAMLGVIIGVAAVTLLIALGQGAKTYIAREFDRLGANVLIVRPGKTEGSGGLIFSSSTARKLTYDDALALKRRVSLLEEVVPAIIGSARIKYLNKSRNVRVQGVTPGNRNLFHLPVEMGSFLTNQDVEGRRQVVVLGAKVQRELFGDDASLGRIVTLENVRYRIIGVIGPRGELLGLDLDDTVFVPVRTAQILFGMNYIHEIRASVENPAMIDQAVAEIRSLLLKRQGNQEDFHIITQGAVLSTLASVVDVLTALLAGIAGISLLVGGIGIMNIMLVSVIERTPEIGLCKAVGARRRDILLQFLVESVTLSVMGGIVGIIVGVTGAGLIPRFFANAPTEVPFWSILIAFTSSAVVGIFFGTYPARKASLLDPIAALRHE